MRFIFFCFCTIFSIITIANALPSSSTQQGTSPFLTDSGFDNGNSYFLNPNSRKKNGKQVPNEYIVRLKSGQTFDEHIKWLQDEIKKENSGVRLKKRDANAVVNQFGEQFMFQFPESSFTNTSKISSMCYYQGRFSDQLAAKIKQRPEVVSIAPNNYIGFDTILDSEKNTMEANGEFSNSISNTSNPALFNAFYANNADNKLLKKNLPEGPHNNEKAQTQLANWGLDRIDQRYLPLNGEYDYVVAGGANVDVYVLDSGVRADHVDFGGRAENVFCTVQPCTDDAGHGTHVAGIIGGATYGVAKSAQIHAIKILNKDGEGSEQNVIRGLQFVVKEALQRSSKCVINISSGSTSMNEMILALIDVIVQQADCVVVVAAGNEDSNACEVTPANSKNVIVVGNSDKNDLKFRSSNWGPCVTLFAPGVGIRSLYNTSSTATATMTGTSMSAPFVTGVVAVHRSMFPKHRAFQIHELIQISATPKVIDGIQLNWFFRQFPWNWGREETINRVLYSRLYETIEDS